MEKEIEKEHKFRRDEDGDIYGICPKCKAKIYSLILVETGSNMYDVVVNEGGWLDFEEKGFEADDEKVAYRCPECYEEIANTDEEARAIFEASK